MSNRREGLTVTWVLLAFFFSAASSAAADPQAEERAALERVRASHLAATGRCAEAVDLAESLSSRDAATEFMIGKCAVAAQQYARALPALERARELDPELLGVELYRGIALYHLEDFDAARGALADARVTGEEAALLEFYQGLLLLREDKPRESALAFERAAARGPARVEPVASYYAALAWQSLNENEPLNSAVDRVREEEPAGPWADEAEKLVALQAQRHRGGQTGLQRWLNLRVGQEYDSNVLLRGTGADRPTNISSDDDWRTVWSASVGTEIIEIDRWTLGTMMSYAGNAHDDLDEFDQHYVVGTLWADREIRATTLARLRLDVGAGWVDDESYLYHLQLEALGEERWGRLGTTRCSVGLQLNDYRWDFEAVGEGIENREDEFEREFGSDLDQDGVGMDVGCEHELPLTVLRALEPDVYGGYRFSSYFANGDEWDHIANEVHLGLRLRLFLDIAFDVRGTYTRRDFRDASFFNDPSGEGADHQNDAREARVELSKELNDFIEVSARYEYLDNGSNAEGWDYKRHVAGAYIELEFR